MQRYKRDALFARSITARRVFLARRQAHAAHPTLREAPAPWGDVPADRGDLEVVQVAVEGVEQLETYFAAYLLQLFYAMLAPPTLFAVLSTVSLRAALVLLVCVPLIPVSIAAVQTWAKKLLSRYWGQYTELGDTFLENKAGWHHHLPNAGEDAQ